MPPCSFLASVERRALVLGSQEPEAQRPGILVTLFFARSAECHMPLAPRKRRKITVATPLLWVFDKVVLFPFLPDTITCHLTVYGWEEGVVAL